MQVVEHAIDQGRIVASSAAVQHRDEAACDQPQAGFWSGGGGQNGQCRFVFEVREGTERLRVELQQQRS
ncbi:hypothetical protein [Krasilnikovia sp. M28-CT-15]|uniref:hypothetical protein n=1 Tax=Krasilnikovia sp. M28-CT-15 TaxID=3373540 RepID=UPI00399C5FC3